MVTSPMNTLDLDARLSSAAHADWAQVARRCAWCGRVSYAGGRYRALRIVDPERVYTDGMCPDCGVRALAQVRQRALAAGSCVEQSIQVAA
jgi:hypothetical protein